MEEHVKAHIPYKHWGYVEAPETAHENSYLWSCYYTEVWLINCGFQFSSGISCWWGEKAKQV